MIEKFISKLSDQEKKIFYITIGIVVIALFDRLFLGPVLNRLNMIDEQIESSKNSIKRDIRFLSYKDKIINESEAFSKYFTHNIEDEDVINSEFLKTIEQFASQSNVNLVKSNPAEIKKKKRYIEYYATLDCVGELEDVITFMHKINSSDDLFKIVKFNMTPKRGASDEVNVSMTVMKMIINLDISNDLSAS